MRRWLRTQIGIDELLTKLRNGWQWCKYDLKPYADRARSLTPQIKVVLHYTINQSMSDTQIIHQLLSQLGIKLTMHWSRSHPGYEGEKLRIYRLDQTIWEQMWLILQRRQEKRQQLQRAHADAEVRSGSPVGLEFDSLKGDPDTLGLDEWEEATNTPANPKGSPYPVQNPPSAQGNFFAAS